MYNTATSQHDQANDSKQTVADILSSMANGDPSSTAYTSGSYNITTPTLTLTPSTLTSIEQTFLELSSSNHGQDRHMQSGFVPPLIEPTHMMDRKNDGIKSDPDWIPSPRSSTSSPKRKNREMMREEDIYTPGYLSTSRRPPKRQRNDEHQVSHEEIQRRSLRRERNKQAAAKCRQRRVDHTNILVEETEGLEDAKNDLENEIQSLQQQKEQLEFLLQAHKPLCKMLNGHSHNGIKVEGKQVACSGGLPPMSRPNTLPIAGKNGGVITTSSGPDIPITTPSSGIFTFGLDSIVDGHTGLTPITGESSVSCSSQVQRNTHDGGSPDTLNSPTLISL